MRYGNKDGAPVHHLNESINEGRVSPRGIANQGWLKKTLETHTLIHPDKRVSIDLRASNDQIIAVGILNPVCYDVLPHMWSGDHSYRVAWDVEWKEVLNHPLSPSELCSRYGIEETELKEQFHHAHHSWSSPDLTMNSVPQSPIGDWFEITYDYIKEQIQIIGVMESFLSQTLERKDHLAISKHAKAILDILGGYPRDNVSTASSWRENLKTTPSKKRKKKKSSRPKMSKAQKKERSFAKKMRKIIAEAEELGITGDYAMAKYFSEKGYARKDGKRKWNSTTVGKYRTKYVLDK